MSFKKEAEELGIDQESGEWLLSDKASEAENLSGEPEEWYGNSVESEDEQDSLCMILSEEKRRNQDRGMQTDPLPRHITWTMTTQKEEKSPSVESSEFNEVAQIDHEKICMTKLGCNQILVIIDHLTKLAVAVPCERPRRKKLAIT